MVGKKEFDEFYGRDRDIELEQLDKNIKKMGETLPEPEHTLFLERACHLDNACFEVASNLAQLLLLTPKDKYKDITNQVIANVSQYLGWEIEQVDGPLHPDFDLDRDYELVDKTLQRFNNKISKISF